MLLIFSLWGAFSLWGGGGVLFCYVFFPSVYFLPCGGHSATFFSFRAPFLNGGGGGGLFTPLIKFLLAPMGSS